MISNFISFSFSGAEGWIYVVNVVTGCVWEYSYGSGAIHSWNSNILDFFTLSTCLSKATPSEVVLTLYKIVIL